MSLIKKINDKSAKAWNNAWKSQNIGSSLSTIAGGLTGVAEAGIANAQIKDTSAEESLIEGVNTTQFSSGNFDSLIDQFDSTAMARNNFTRQELRGLSDGQMAGNVFKGAASGAIAGAQVGGPWGAVIGGVVGLGSGIAGIAVGNKRAREKANQLNNDAQIANASYLNNFSNSVENTQNTMFNNSLLNIASYGGPLYNLTGDFTNGLTFIDAGGTHEQNPFGGVQVGVDYEGTPNLVEEGEVIYNDYVFSNRLKPTKKQLADGGFKDKYDGYTFAKLVEDISKPYMDTPNDPITKAGLEDMMNRIMTMQEEIRAKKNVSNTNKFDIGGPTKDPYLETYLRNFRNQALKPLELENEPPMFIPYNPDSIPTVQPVTGNVSVLNNNGKPVNPSLTAPVVDTDDGANTFNWSSLGRYAPIVADAAGLITNLLTEPDYTNAEAGVKAMRNVPVVDTKPVGNYLQLDKIDRNYLLNPLMANARSAARAMQNQGLNAAQTQLGLLAQQHELNKGIGQTLMEADRENMNREIQEAQFNLNIDQTNAVRALQADQMNQQNAYNIAQAEAQAAQMREAIDAQRTAAINQNISGLTEGLSGIGQEAVYKDWLGALVDKGAIQDVFGTPKVKTKKCGGKLLTKKRK